MIACTSKGAGFQILTLRVPVVVARVEVEYTVWLHLFISAVGVLALPMLTGIAVGGILI